MQSRLPNKQVIYDLLSLYEEFRKVKRNSVANAFKYGFEYATSVITGKAPVDDDLDYIVKEINAEVRAAQQFVDFYKLIFKLREKAEYAQDLKYLGDESVLRGTLHAIANIIICDLVESEEFYQKVQELTGQVKAIEKRIAFCMKDKRGKGIQDENNELKKVILELSLLGETDYINTAMLFNSLGKLTFPDVLELTTLKCEEIAIYSAPVQLQRQYARWFFGHIYQPFITIDYERFVQLAMEKSQEKTVQNIVIEQPKSEPNQKPENKGDTQNMPLQQSADLSLSPVKPPIIQTDSSAQTTQAAVSNVSLFKQPIANIQENYGSDETKKKRLTNSQ